MQCDLDIEKVVNAHFQGFSSTLFCASKKHSKSLFVETRTAESRSSLLFMHSNESFINPRAHALQFLYLLWTDFTSTANNDTTTDLELIKR